MQPERATVALVSGASRGAGRGIAQALGEVGATVYVTARTVTEDEAPEGISGTITETARLVEESGGRGIAVQCDHSDLKQLRALASRIEREEGGLDLLVNSAWGGYEQYDSEAFSQPFWKLDPVYWERMFENGVRLTLLTTQILAPLMIRRESGLIVNITAWDRDRYLHTLIYDAAKAAVNRITFGVAQELKAFQVAAVALAPGFMRTERVMAAYEKSPFDLSGTETPLFTGRVICAMVDDPNILSMSGKTFRVGTLGASYGVVDEDGSQPEPFEIPDFVSAGQEL